MAKWNDTSSTERGVYGAANFLSSLIMSNARNEYQSQLKAIDNKQKMQSDIVNQSVGLAKDLIGGIGGHFKEKQDFEDFVGGLENLGASENILNAAKSAPNLQAAKDLVSLGMIAEKHTGLSANGGEFYNPLTGETRTYEAKEDPLLGLKAQVLRSKINAPQEAKREWADLANFGVGIDAPTQSELVEMGLGRFYQDKDGNIAFKGDWNSREAIKQYVYEKQSSNINKNLQSMQGRVQNIPQTQNQTQNAPQTKEKKRNSIDAPDMTNAKVMNSVNGKNLFEVAQDIAVMLGW